jgi:cell division septal protein FtsQ
VKNKERERQSRSRTPSESGSKTPLTFYRSGENQADSKSPFKKKDASASKLRNFIYSVLNTLAIMLLLGLLAYSLVVKPASKIESSSQIFHQNAEYKQAADKTLRGLRYSNKISFSESALTQQLQKQFPEISGIRVELPIFSQTPVIHLKISNAEFALSSSGQSYIIDANGAAVAKSSDYPSSQKLINVEDQSGFKVEVGKQVMSAGAVEFINTLVKQSKHGNVSIASLALPKLAQELDLKTTDRSYYVKFYLGGDVNLQSGQFLAARHQFDATNSQPAEYLDVRIPGKIFYK